MATSLIGTYTDQQAEQIALQGLLESVCSNPLDCANSLMEVSFFYDKPSLSKPGPADDTNATDATAELVLAYVPRRAKLVSCTYTPSTSTNLTAAASNNATLNVFARPGLTGVTSTLTLATAVTTVLASGGTGNFAQWTPVVIPVNAFDPTNNVIPAGGSLTFSIVKNSSGVVVPGGRLHVRIQYV